MILPLTPGQKIIAYSSLVFILAWMAFGLFAIWMFLTNP